MSEGRRAPLHLAVIVPSYQAGATLPRVLERLAAVHPPADTWVIDDGSRDGTGEVARSAGVHVERHDVNRGKGAGLLTGFRATAGYDAVATLDADGQHKPEDLPRMVGGLAHADLVVGARVRSGAMPPHRRLGNALSAAYLSWIAGTRLPDVQSGYRIHRSSVLRALGLQPAAGATPSTPPPAFRSTGYGFESEILIAAARLGFTIAHVPIEALYEGAPSHFDPLRELPRFASLYARLLADAARWSAYRRARAAAGAGEGA
ncbi:MAG: glycosyltransferase family 2 protein [Candidatus Eisenbacteria bacterium]